MTGKKIAVQDFDSADYLDTPKDIPAYLDDVFADGDEAAFAEALRVIARSKAMARIAEETDLDVPASTSAHAEIPNRRPVSRS